MGFTQEQKEWIDEVWEKLDAKLWEVAKRSEKKLPLQGTCGIHDDLAETNITGWTNGFWPGLMWIMYAGTGKEQYKKTAETGERLLDQAFAYPEKLSHDVGFMWKLAAGPDYQLTGSVESLRRLRRAADHLMGRYNPVGEYIRAWNWGKTPGERAGWTIIDTMMNLSLLYWASEECEDPRFKFVAMKHADKAIQSHIRPDGSVRHIVAHDPYTGSMLEEKAGQGYGIGSSWSRGQAWAIYGYTLSYLHTGKPQYLEVARNTAHYFIANVCDDWLPKADFRSPSEPVFYDASAGACAACGLIELASIVPEQEKRLYEHAAIMLLQTMERAFADWSKETDFFLGMSSRAYGSDTNMNFIYGDYFYAEAIYKLKGFKMLFW